MIFAILLIVIGVVFFARTLGFISDVSMNVLWPLGLIILGLTMLSHKTFGHQCNEKDCWRCAEVSFAEKGGRKRK